MSPTYQRVALVATGIVLVAGCGDKGLEKPLPHAQRALAVSLPWKSGGQIPRRYTCDGGDHKPAVGSPAKSKDFAIVMTDPDAPGGTFVHWTSWNGAEGKNSFGRVGYSGPCPPKGDRPHHYVVTVYLLRRALGLAAGTAPEKVVTAVQKLAVASGSSTGLYGR